MNQTAAKPQRIQRKRTPGYDMQAESMALNGLPAVAVCRPGKWGNPFRVGVDCLTANTAVRYYLDWLRWPQDYEDKPKAPTMKEIQEKLRGKNLACFCGLSDSCHADVLLEIANANADTKDTL